LINWRVKSIKKTFVICCIIILCSLFQNTGYARLSQLEYWEDTYLDAVDFYEDNEGFTTGGNEQLSLSNGSLRDTMQNPDTYASLNSPSVYTLDASIYYNLSMRIRVSDSSWYLWRILPVFTNDTNFVCTMNYPAVSGIGDTDWHTYYFDLRTYCDVSPNAWDETFKQLLFNFDEQDGTVDAGDWLEVDFLDIYATEHVTDSATGSVVVTGNLPDPFIDLDAYDIDDISESTKTPIPLEVVSIVTQIDFKDNTSSEIEVNLTHDDGTNLASWFNITLVYTPISDTYRGQLGGYVDGTTVNYYAMSYDGQNWIRTPVSDYSQLTWTAEVEAGEVNVQTIKINNYDLLREINEEAEYSAPIIVMGLISLIPVVIVVRAFIDHKFRMRVLKRFGIK
jgi:hypothetical protein